MAKTPLTLALLCVSALAQDTWKFAVSGDSRNCGDIVMPAIAAGVLKSGAQFYWHLGDFRAIYAFDEDMVPPLKLNLPHKPMFISTYLSAAWPDFIAHQLDPFGDLPIFLGMGNHETVFPATRDAWLIQFADWLENPMLRAQRLKDNPQDHKLRSYFHWVKSNLDFISLDNSSPDQFDSAQLDWLLALLQRDEANPKSRPSSWECTPRSPAASAIFTTWVIGRKAIKPAANSISGCGRFRNPRTSASMLSPAIRTCIWKTSTTLPIGKTKCFPVGSSEPPEPCRHRIPPEAGPSQKAQTDVYGYLIATVSADSSVIVRI